MIDQDAHAKPLSHYEYVAQDVSKIKQTAIKYMRQLDGWCSEEKAFILIDLILTTKPQKIVEIGVWGGKSLVPMAYALKTNKKGIVYGIDPWDNNASIQWMKDEANTAFWSQVDHEAILRRLIQKIDQFELGNHIELLKCTSEGAPPISDIDILHIDGNHSDETSYFDTTKWVPLVKSGGWIIFDDMTWSEEGFFTTARAVEWLNAHCIKYAQHNDICDWGIWRKP